MKKLELNQLYGREEVQQIFEPEYNFVPSTGTWGISGLIRIPSRPRDYVFFVSYGQSQGDHVFKEGIDENGVLTWQSQPRNSLKTKKIQDLIGHDDTKDNIYLFLDDSGKKPQGARQYKYLGKLGYLEHDPELENPVYFKFLLLDLNLDTDLTESNIKPKQTISRSDNLPSKLSISTEHFRKPKKVNYAKRDSENRALGLSGEQAILKHEIEKLESISRKDLAKKVIHTSVVQGDGAGYDIQSFDESGNKIYIEVKTTKGNIDTEFFISSNEVSFNMSNENAYIYRVYNFGSEGESFYILDNVEDLFDLKPTNYKVKLKNR